MSSATDQTQAAAGSSEAAGAASFDEMDQGDLRQGLMDAEAGKPAAAAAGGEEAVGDDKVDETVEAGAGTAPAKEPEPGKTDEEGGADDEELPPAASIEELEQAVADFKFTATELNDERRTEEQQFLEMVELPPQIQEMLDLRDARITELAALVPAEGEPLTGVAARYVPALDAMLDYKQDPLTKDFAPDTSAIRELLNTDFPKEKQALVIDLNIEPSPKYQGLTRYQEFLVDTFRLDAHGLAELQGFFDNGGKFSVPSFVPAGIEVKVAEAYWNSIDRTEIDEKLNKAQFTLTGDSYANDADKEAAKQTIQKINQGLAQVQLGIDAQNRQRQTAAQQSQQVKTEIENAGEIGYFETTVGLLGTMKADISKDLGVFDQTGNEITAVAYSTLVEKALSDTDAIAKMAQADLKAAGIPFDWKKGRGELDRLWNVELEIAALKKSNIVGRAMEKTLEKKTGILKEIKGLQKELTGKIKAKLVVGAGVKLKESAGGKEGDGKGPTKVAVRPRIKGEGGGAKAPAVTNFDDVPIEKLRALIGEKKAQEMARGR